MKLWHVSDHAAISSFEPRVPTNADAGITHPVVWAVADSHLVNSLTRGTFVSSEAVVAVHERRVDSPLEELIRRGAELRVVPRLRPVAEAVATSSLAFSIIRLRNAAE